jgi:hypothetical protein
MPACAASGAARRAPSARSREKAAGDRGGEQRAINAQRATRNAQRATRMTPIDDDDPDNARPIAGEIA